MKPEQVRDQLRDQRRKAEAAINVILTRLQAETGLQVVGIDYRPNILMGAGLPLPIIELQLQVPK